MITLLLFSLIVYAVISSVAFYQANKQNRLYWQDISAPFLVIISWMLITSLGYGHQSLSHLIELPIALLLTAIGFNLKVFWFDLRTDNRIAKRYGLWIAGLIFVILLRSFMPYLPE